MFRASSRHGGAVRRRRRTTTTILVLVVLGALLLGACQPERPSDGRGTPVRRVLVVGDSITFGIFGTTPTIRPALLERMGARGIATRIVGFPGNNLLEPWEGQPSYADEVRYHVASFDPDMVVIQSIAFPQGADPARQQAYVRAATEVIRLARARGAHVYIVSHHDPRDPVIRQQKQIAEFIQGAVAGPGVSKIPLDWWMSNCRQPTGSDGWHLSASGQECHAAAVTAAVDQLRGRNG